MKKFIVILSFFASISLLTAQQSLPQVEASDKNWGFKGYAGGMFYHVGYVKSKPFAIFDAQNQQYQHHVEGFTSGIGGKMGFFIHKNLKIGIEGYSSSASYGPNKSKFKMGWGGIAIDYLYRWENWMPFVGCHFGGGGSTHTIFLEEQNQNTLAQQVIYFKEPHFIISPSIGVEYLVSKKISFLFKVDYQFSVAPKGIGYASGPRFYLGIHFYRKK